MDNYYFTTYPYMNYQNQPRFTTPPQHEVYRHAKAGDMQKVKYWLEEQNYPIDKQDFYSNTVLYYGCLCNHPGIVSYLMERGATFQQHTADGKRTFLSSSNQIIRNLLLGRPVGDVKVPPPVELWYSDAFQNTSFSDVTFIVNGKSFPAHKSIIAARCPHLIPKMEKQSTITFNAAISELTFSTILNYIYTDKVDAAIVKELKGLGKVASKLGLKGLADFCADILITDIDERNTMKPFVNNPLFSDITLTTPDGASIHCHKIILTTRCDYFKTLFSMNWDNNSAELQLAETTKDVLEIIIQYIYSGTYVVNSNNIWEALASAGLFLLPRLQYDLELEIVRNYLDVESCIELAVAADVLSCAKVYKASLRVIANNYATLHTSQPFKDLPESINNDVENIVHPKKGAKSNTSKTTSATAC